MLHLNDRTWCLPLSLLGAAFAVFFSGSQLVVSASVASDDATDSSSSKPIKSHPVEQKRRMITAEDVRKRTEEYNRAAIRLFEEGRYLEAQGLWEKAIDMIESPLSRPLDFADSMDEDRLETGQVMESGGEPVRDVGAAEDVEDQPDWQEDYAQQEADKTLISISPELEVVYKEGATLFRQKDYTRAKEKFLMIAQSTPEYKSTAEYLKRIDFEVENQRQRELEKSREALAHEIRAEKYGKEIEHAATGEREVSPRQAVQESQQTVADMYDEAVGVYKAEQWDVAEQKLMETERILGREDVGASFKRKYEKRIVKLRQDIQRQRAQEQKHQSELQPISGEEKTPIELKSLEEGVFATSSDPQVVAAQYDRIQKERQKVQNAFRARIKQLYAKAVRLYQKGYYPEAKQFFEEIDQVQPSFKKTRTYLSKANQEIAARPMGIFLPPSEIVADPIYVKPRAQTISEALDRIEAPAP